MATINSTKGSGNQSFKQIEGDNWSSIYLPAICAGILMTVALFMAVSCSKKMDQPASGGISAPAPAASTQAASTPAPVVPAPPKKAKKVRPANATYVNGTYGVSFTYPVKYSLQAGTKNSAVPVQAGFLKTGGLQVASVDMPGDSYPDTDFSSALFNVSVNPNMTELECANFVVNEANKDSAKPTSVKLGSNEFTEFERMSGEPTHQTDMKYFHLFKNGACYEFSLDVETERRADDELAQVDRGKVFQKLEKILSTARIKDVEIAGAVKPETTAPPAISDLKVEKAQVVSPAEQK